jgi:hypothetical protein
LRLQPSLSDRLYRFHNVLRRYAKGIHKFVRFAECGMFLTAISRDFEGAAPACANAANTASPIPPSAQ